ncbi:MAG: chalcone isomerase family protein [Betaproteobacteria bacterium]|nr:chalcone isomerase family protein [Betaproteobacteria bacterium]
MPNATFSRRGFWRGAVAMAWAAGAAPGLAHAAAAVGAPPELVASTLAHVRLAGSGVFRWWGFTVYSAALWVGPQGLDTARLTAAPFALELRYARGLKGAAIAGKSIEEIRKLGFGSAAQQDSWLAQMRAIFPNVSDGDALCGLFEPTAAGGPRTVFLFNGKAVGTVPGNGFALGFFSIWLSAQTIAPDLRTALLAQAAP